MDLIHYLPKKLLTSQDDVDFDWVRVMPCDNENGIKCELFSAIIINKKKGIYQLENVPYKLTHVFKSDIIYAELDEKSNYLVYKYTILASGNSSIQACIINPLLEIEGIGTKIRSIGNYFVQINEFEFLLNMDPKFEYNNELILKYLDELVLLGIINYKLIHSK